MIIASGNSDRHVRSIADRVVERAKAAGFRPYGREGERDGEWVLVDLNDVIVHVMLPRVREFYGLEHLWEPPAAAATPARKSARPAKKKASGTGKTSARTSTRAGAAQGNARPAARARKSPARRRTPRPAG
jgi:hypothetical protein